jgi:branched-chain amino acid transport system permease protein
MFKNQQRPLFVIGMLLLLVLILPLLITQRYTIRILVMIAYFAVAAYGWDIIGGYGGQISIGQAAFFAVGAYSVALGYLDWNLSPIIGMLIGVALAVLVAWGIGSVLFRLRAAYFTLGSLAVSIIVQTLLLHFKHLTGGPEGKVIPYTGYNLHGLQFSTDVPYYYIAFALLIVAIITSYFVQHSRLGYQLAAIRNNEDAAQSIGINLMMTKVKAFMVSAILTSLAGSFYVIYDHYIDPSSTCSMDLSIKILLIALLGGRRSIWGPLVGAVVMIPLTEVTNAYFGSVRPGISNLLYSIVLIIVVLFAPNGIIRIFKKGDGKDTTTKGVGAIAAN